MTPHTITIALGSIVTLMSTTIIAMIITVIIIAMCITTFSIINITTDILSVLLVLL